MRSNNSVSFFPCTCGTLSFFSIWFISVSFLFVFLFFHWDINFVLLVIAVLPTPKNSQCLLNVLSLIKDCTPPYSTVLLELWTVKILTVSTGNFSKVSHITWLDNKHIKTLNYDDDNALLKGTSRIVFKIMVFFISLWDKKEPKESRGHLKAFTKKLSIEIEMSKACGIY